MAKALIVAIVCVTLVGCASKSYVNKGIADSEQRTGSRLNDLSGKTDGNTSEISRLQNLSVELSKKTDLAINKATGFEDYVVAWEGNITFAFDRAELDGVAREILGTAAEKMAADKKSIIEIVGHTDAVGPASYNYQLGDRRANAAKRYLSEKFSIQLYRMFILSMGKDQLISASDVPGGNAKNRRVTLRVWAPSQPPPTN